MLLVLAWLLWLYHQNKGKDDRQAADGSSIEQDEVFKENVETFNKRASLNDCLEEVSRVAVTDRSDDCLFIGSAQKHLNGHITSTPTRRNTVNEEVATQSNAAATEQSYDNNFDDWDHGAVVYRDENTPIRKAKLLVEKSIKRDEGEELSFENRSKLLVGTENETSPVKEAKLFSQPSIKRPKVFVSTENDSKQTLDSNNSNHSALTTSISSLSVNVNNSNERVRKISESKIELEPPAITVKISSSSDNEAEDFEEPEAFSTENKDEKSEMNYKVKGRVRTTVKNEAAGRIHSIVVNNRHQTNLTKVRVVSPSIVNIKLAESPVHIISNSKTSSGLNRNDKINGEVHTTVKNEAHSTHVNKNHQLNPTAPVDLVLNSKTSNGSSNQHDAMIEKQQVDEENAITPSILSFVESGNSSFQLDEKEPSNNTIKDSKKQKKDPKLLKTPTAELTDFNTVMKRRKNKVDTMDNVSRFLGQFGHRDEKIGGRVLSKNWSKVKDAVQKRQYLHFED